MLPLMVALRDQPVLVVGAGAVAAAKIQLLRAEGARLTVVSPEVLRPLPDDVIYRQKYYEEGDMTGFRLVVAAVGDAEVNEIIREEATRRGIFLNVVDNPSLCDFFFTAVHRDGDVVVSVSTQGAAPALAQLIRDHIATSLPTGVGHLAATLRARRVATHQAGASTESLSWKESVRREWSDLFTR